MGRAGRGRRGRGGVRGFAVTAWAALLLLNFGCMCGMPPPSCGGGGAGRGPRGAGGFSPMAAVGPTHWTVEGRDYAIPSSYYLVLPGETGQRELMFVAELDGLDPTETEGLTEPGAAELALPVMEHIVREGLYRRSEIRPSGEEPLEVEWIGIVVMTESGPLRSSGVRTRRRLAELRALLDGTR